MTLYFRFTLMLVMTIILTHNIYTQRPVERPSQISRDLREISLILEEVTAEERRFKTKLAEYNDELGALRDEIERLPVNSRKRGVAAEKYEKIFSEALAEQYEFLYSIKQARDRTVRLLERVIDGAPAENTAIDHITNSIAEVDNTISNARREIKKIAVLIRYSSSSPEEQAELAEAMIAIEDNKLSLNQRHREFLEHYKSQIASVSGNMEHYRSNLHRMLEAVKSRSQKVDVALDRIRVVAAVQQEFANKRRDFTELSKSIAILQDMLKEAYDVDREMTDFWADFSPEFMLDELSLVPDFDSVEHTDFEFGQINQNRRDRIDPQQEARRILERK